jgi:hypothetical protein
MLQLPDVTLLLIDTICHELATRSIDKCVSQANFGDVLCFSDRNIWPGYRPVKITSLDEYQDFLWYGVPWQKLNTSHVLHIHWDGWINEPSCGDGGSIWQRRRKMVTPGGGLPKRCLTLHSFPPVFDMHPWGIARAKKDSCRATTGRLSAC